MEHSVGTRTLRGMFWAYGSYVGGRALVLLSVAVLARLLTPGEFGLVAFALTVTTLLDAVAGLGVAQALVVARDDILRKANTAWTLGLLLGLGLALVTVAIAPLAAEFFGDDEIVPILAALGLTFLIRGAGSTHYALAQRDIEFRPRTAAELADVIVRGSVGVVAALLGAGAWSLVLGYLAGSTAMTLTLWRLVDFRPRLAISRRDAGTLLRFGGGLAVLGALSAVIANTDYLVIGRVLGETELGLYSLAYRLPELLIMNLSVIAGVVLFPAFSALAREELGRAFLTSLRFTMIVTVPLTLGLAVLAEPVVAIAFGDQWDGAVDAMRVIALACFIFTLGIPAGTAYKSVERLDVLIKLAIPRTVITVAAIVAVADEGIVAVAAAKAAVSAVFELLGIVLAARLLGTGLARIAGALAPGLLAGAVMAPVLLGVRGAVDGDVLTLVLAAAAGAVVYLGALWLLVPDALRRFWRLAFPRGAAAAAR